MPERQFIFDRDIDLSPAIVWDALIDEELVVGWLAAASIDPVQGGSYDLLWQYSTDQPPTAGIITRFDARELLVIETDNRGRIEFSLIEIVGDRRDSATRLTLTVTVELDRTFLSRVHANWMISLDQLLGLLRGRPVDWANWDRDQIEVWTEYRDRFAARR